MSERGNTSKGGLPVGLRVCQCTGCFKHESIFKDSEYCGSPFLIVDGTECSRCQVANCPTCAIRCGDCNQEICRDCDLCEWCDRYACMFCVRRKHCVVCNKAFCDTAECSAPMDECTYCRRLVCDECDNYEISTKACAGRNGGCNTRCCPDCPTGQKLHNCLRCKLDVCLVCLKEHRGRDCRR